jgi:hypothetical protein
VAVARRSGEIALLDSRGKIVAQMRAGQPVRRLRVFDTDGDGRDEAVIGDEGGSFVAVAADGRQTPLGSLGDTVTEIRALTAPGAGPRPFVVAGKQGAFLLQAGRVVHARGTVRGKASAAGSVDGDGDGREELFVGTEEGGLSMFDGAGALLAEVRMPGKVERIFGMESGLRDRLVVVAAGSALEAYRVRRARPPAWYSPWVAAAVGLLAVAGAMVALALTVPPPAPPPPAPVDGRLQALDLAIARVNDLSARRLAKPQMAAARLRQLERLRAKLGG